MLIVDDDSDAAETLAEILASLGHVTKVAGNGLAALEALNECPLDVVLLDIGLPLMDGYELARRMRATAGASKTRLFAMSGYGQNTDRERSREAGFDAHFVKPLDLDAVVRAVETAARSD